MASDRRKKRILLTAIRSIELDMSDRLRGDGLILLLFVIITAPALVESPTQPQAMWLVLPLLILLPACAGWMAHKRRLRRLFAVPEYYAHRGVRRRLLDGSRGQVDRILCLRREPARVDRAAAHVGIVGRDLDHVRREQQKDRVLAPACVLVFMAWCFVFWIGWCGRLPPSCGTRADGFIPLIGALAGWTALTCTELLLWVRQGRRRVRNEWTISPYDVMSKLGYEWRWSVGWRRRRRSKMPAPQPHHSRPSA